MASISTVAFLGSVLTATQLRAGLWTIHFSYSAFISAKSAMSARKMLTLTIFWVEEPASLRTASRFLKHSAVFSAMVPSIRVPWGSRWIWPEQ